MQWVTKTEFGMEIDLRLPLDLSQSEEMLAEVLRKLPPAGTPFGVMVDARTARAYLPATLDVFKRVIHLLRENGMQRRAVIVTSSVLLLQSQRLARETGTLPWTRYINSNDRPGWYQAAVAWLVEGVDPDLS